MLWPKIVAAGPNLPPAPYKSLPVGTTLDYGWWKCTVEASEGLDTVCADRSQMARFFGKFIVHGEQDKNGYGGETSEVPIDGRDYVSLSIPDISMTADARRSIRALWPLAVGKRSRFVLKHDAARDDRIEMAIEVTATERRSVAGRERDLYVVRANSDFYANMATATIEGSGPGGMASWGIATPPYSNQQTWWYDPVDGIVVEAKLVWEDFPIAGFGHGYKLVKATFPGAPAIAKATPTPKPPVAKPTTVVAARALAEVTPSPKPPVAILTPPVVQPKVVAVAPPRRSTPPPAPARRPDPYAGIHFGAYHALVIGNNRYRNLPGLKTAAGDAQAVAAVLREDYGFGVDLLVDATRSDIFKALARLRSRLTANDNLLIYYAGHGYLDDIAQLGYWLPVDSDRDVQTNWISNGDVTAMLRAIRAKHIMVVADSCYAGTLVRSAGARLKTMEARAAWIARMASKRSRTALVSGGLEPVADSGGGTGRQHSVFARALLTALRDNTGVMDGNALFNAIKRPVVLDADQTPQYSDIRRAGHDGGDFLFVKRR